MYVPKVTGHYRVGRRALSLCRQSQVLAVLDGLFNHIFKGPDEGADRSWCVFV